MRHETTGDRAARWLTTVTIAIIVVLAISVPAARPSPAGSVVPEDEACVACHAPTRGEHPVGVPVTGSRRADLPLSADGRITCLTCHNAHRDGSTRAGQRVPTAELCVACHPF